MNYGGKEGLCSFHPEMGLGQSKGAGGMGAPKQLSV